jgi:hypothetical protein
VFPEYVIDYAEKNLKKHLLSVKQKAKVSSAAIAGT